MYTITSFSAKLPTCSCWDGLRCGCAGLNGKDVGFARPKSWGKAFGVGITVGVAIELFELIEEQGDRPTVPLLFQKVLRPLTFS